MRLQELGGQHNTDKGDLAHSFRGVSYLDVYASYLADIREQVRCVLELGVLGGSSLKMWCDYFPQATVWGVDINPDSVRPYGPRIQTVLGSQADPAAIAQVAPGQMIDLVIDDGSHLVDHMVDSFKLLWPRVNNGGFYVMEDMRLTWNHDITPTRIEWPGQNCNGPDTNFVNVRAKMQALFDEKIDAMDKLQGDVRFCHFWPMMVVFKKV